MHLSRAGDYAIRVALDLAQNPGATIKEVAQRQAIPETYLAKVIHDLSRAGLVQTQRGPHGGIRLSQNAQAILLKEVLEAAQGPLSRDPCLVWLGLCPHIGHCPIPPLWHRLQEAVSRELEGVTMADLAQGPLAPMSHPTGP